MVNQLVKHWHSGNGIVNNMAKMSSKMVNTYAKYEKKKPAQVKNEPSATKKNEVKAGVHKMPNGKMMANSAMKVKTNKTSKKK